jgi:pantoate--beta-alanine ligase
MSSRNAYLSPEQRQQATVLSRSLTRVEALFGKGEHDASRLAEAGKKVMAEEPSVRLDYYEVVNPNTLEPVCDTSGGALVAVAAFAGSTRLIDNVVLQASA